MPWEQSEAMKAQWNEQDQTVTGDDSRRLGAADADCIVAGGGPAGLVCGLVLARLGVRVTVVEKHDDFLRDFRGDTIHPSTQDLLAELGLLDEFLTLPHEDMPRVTPRWNEEEFVLADFSRPPTRRRVISFMPQWEFLDLIARAALREPTFTRARALGGHRRRPGGRADRRCPHAIVDGGGDPAGTPRHRGGRSGFDREGRGGTAPPAAGDGDGRALVPRAEGQW